MKRIGGTCNTLLENDRARIMNNKHQKEFKAFGLFFHDYELELYIMVFEDTLPCLQASIIEITNVARNLCEHGRDGGKFDKLQGKFIKY